MTEARSKRHVLPLIFIVKEISGLEKELDENTALSDTQKSLLQSKLDNLRNEMEEINEYRTKGAMLRSRTRWHNEGEKNTILFKSKKKNDIMHRKQLVV